MTSNASMVLRLYYRHGEDIQENAYRYRLTLQDVRDINERLSLTPLMHRSTL